MAPDKRIINIEIDRLSGDEAKQLLKVYARAFESLQEKIFFFTTMIQQHIGGMNAAGVKWVDRCTQVIAEVERHVSPIAERQDSAAIEQPEEERLRPLN